jgi:hypothetical protein
MAAVCLSGEAIAPKRITVVEMIGRINTNGEQL